MLILTILQAFYFIMKSLHTEGSELYSEYATTWVALFHMTLGEYEVGTTAFTINKQLIKFVTFISHFSHAAVTIPFLESQKSFLLVTPIGCRPSPPPLQVGTSGKNNLNEEITSLLLTGISERYCQII
jgi:hypothetical protein